MGKNLVFVPECPSTNTLALEISQQSPVKEGTVVITDHQTAGKGQRGNSWETQPRLNLTFSLILKPDFLAVNKQFYLNIVICLALKDYLMAKTTDIVYIKWPNDILVHEKKISGVLIENQLQGSMITNTITGIGFNVNQKKFSVPTATSLSLVTGDDFDLAEELPLILECIEARYLQARAEFTGTRSSRHHSGDYQSLMNLYLASLYRRHEKCTFATNGEAFEGVIEDLDEWGKLRIQTEDGLRVFGVKEIKYI
jgi:BirA family transcriptional regulator, biotin operon repressor / biotin---[acetyl-CoA-carboxylase] ligase